MKGCRGLQKGVTDHINLRSHCSMYANRSQLASLSRLSDTMTLPMMCLLHIRDDAVDVLYMRVHQLCLIVLLVSMPSTPSISQLRLACSTSRLQ